MSYIIKYFYNFYSSRHCIYIRKNTKENEAGRLYTNSGQNLQLIFILGRTPRKRSKSAAYKLRSKFTAHIYIRKNTKEYEASRLHTNFGQNLQHIFILGRTPRKRNKSVAYKLRSKFTAHIYIRKNTKETKQVGCIQTSVKIYNTYLY